MNEKLRELGLKRDYPVGKRMGNDIWIHKSSAEKLLGEKGYNQMKRQLPNNFNYEVVRYNKKTGEMAFIASPDFNTSHEPIVGDSYKVVKNSDKYEVKLTKSSDKNPLIWHHKWMMVEDDFDGFDVGESKRRSIQWKEKMGIDRELSSKIGRLEYWQQWLSDNEIPFQMGKDEVKPNNRNPFYIYYEENIEQQIDSAATARNQKPKTLSVIEKIGFFLDDKRILDIGCGRQNGKTIEAVNGLGGNYFGIDPFNQAKEVNIKNIELCSNGQSDVVLLNNVLNVIPYEQEEVHLNILEQAKNALSDDGVLFMCIYEGIKTSAEIKMEKDLGIKIDMKPIETRDGYQNRMKTKDYLDRIKKVFPNAEIKSGIVIATKSNPKPKYEKKSGIKKK